MKQFKGYKKKGNKVYLLLRVLYDLKQLLREQYFTLQNFLIFKEFKSIESDYSLFINKKIRLIVSVYVNNIQIYDLKGLKLISKLK